MDVVISVIWIAVWKAISRLWRIGTYKERDIGLNYFWYFSRKPEGRSVATKSPTQPHVLSSQPNHIIISRVAGAQVHNKNKLPSGEYDGVRVYNGFMYSTGATCTICPVPYRYSSLIQSGFLKSPITITQKICSTPQFLVAAPRLMSRSWNHHFLNHLLAFLLHRLTEQDIGADSCLH